MNYRDNQMNRPQFNFPRNTGLFCRYCKTPGHSLEQCRKRQYNNNLQNQGNRFREFEKIE